MIEVITMNDGERVFICSDRDILEVIEHYCGYDFMKLIEKIFDNEDAKEEIEAITQELNTSDSYNDYLRDTLLEIQCDVEEFLINLIHGDVKFSRKQIVPILENITKLTNEVL